MKDPSRWVELSADEFERDLLRSSRGDVPTDRAYRRTLTSLGVGFLAPIAASQVAEGAAQAAALTVVAAPPASLSAAVLLKWLGGGMLLGVVTASGIGIASHTRQHAPVSSSAVALVAPRVQGTPSLGPMQRTVAAPAVSSAPDAMPSPAAVDRGSARAAKPLPAAKVLMWPEPAPLPPALPAPKLADAASIEREVRLLDSARRALARNASADALTILRSYAREFEQGALAPEARVLEVRALLQAGERERAISLGSQIVATDPHSRHAEAVRALIGRASNP